MNAAPSPGTAVAALGRACRRVVPRGRCAAWARILVLTWVASGVVCSAPTSASEVRVQVNGNLVDLDATAAPLPEILDRLARPTGMKVVFDGATPRPLVTISIRGRSPAQTVLAVLEGLGINYALLADDSGLRVQTLLLSGTAAPSSAKSPAFTPRANRNMPVPAAPGDASPDDEVAPIDEGLPPGSEPDMVSPAPPNPPDMSLEGGAPPPNPVPTPQPTPPPYTPSPFLPTAPGAVQPLQPFPAPTPTAPPARP